jgi:hypothetical protein
MTVPEIWWHPGTGSGPTLYIQAELDQPHIWMYAVGSPAELPDGAVALRPVEDGES